MRSPFSAASSSGGESCGAAEASPAASNASMTGTMRAAPMRYTLRVSALEVERSQPRKGSDERDDVARDAADRGVVFAHGVVIAVAPILELEVERRLPLAQQRERRARRQARVRRGARHQRRRRGSEVCFGAAW